jgi:hypothetical protein
MWLMVCVALDIAGKVWNLPNTLVGLGYGLTGHVLAWMLGWRPRITLGNNAIQFHDSPLMLTAMTLGNVVVYGRRRGPETPNVPFCDTPPGHTVGREEFRHTQQGQILGPLYFPAHLVGGISSMLRAPHKGLTCRVDAWHRNNFMETGPMRDRIF